MIEPAPRSYLNRLFIAILILIILFTAAVYSIPKIAEQRIVTIGPFTMGHRGYFWQVVGLANGHVIREVDTVISAQDREKGLSGRTALTDDQGMLFVYAEAERVGEFWMKDMSIPIDIIWLDCSAKVLGVENGLQPDTYPKTYPSPVGTKFVLEVKSGFSRKENINIGDQLLFSTDSHGGSWGGCGTPPKSK